jgi:hypothetical protein
MIDQHPTPPQLGCDSPIPVTASTLNNVRSFGPQSNQSTVCSPNAYTALFDFAARRSPAGRIPPISPIQIQLSFLEPLRCASISMSMPQTHIAAGKTVSLDTVDKTRVRRTHASIEADSRVTTQISLHVYPRVVGPASLEPSRERASRINISYGGFR